MASTGTDAPASTPRKVDWRNIFMFSLGTIGRDFVYQLFSSYLLTYILFTKSLTPEQFASVSVIIIVARLFDAFNDPIMGGIVENTRTRWGKFKPWILAGVLLTGVVVIGGFSTTLQGWSFIGYLAFIYLTFSITYTMNDISYWGMMPALSAGDENYRGKLTTVAQLCASAGGGLAGVIIPVFTTGQWAIGGNAVDAFRWVSVLSVALMVGFQMFTLFGVREAPLPPDAAKSPRLSLKDMFKTILKNDQLLWAALIMLLYSTSTGIVGGGLSMTYIYFSFGYNGLLTTLYGILYAVFSTAFTFFYPGLSKRFGRKTLLTAGGIAMIFGFLWQFVFGAALPAQPWMLKFAMMAIGNGFVGFGQSAFYMILLLSIANSVEYNEWKMGDRKEGLIFSIRPFTSKFSSAMSHFLVMLVYLIVGVTTFTNQISDFENAASQKLITDEQRTAGITGVINGVPEGKKIALLACMCFIPVVFVGVGILLYHKFYVLDEAKYATICAEIEARKLDQAAAADGAADAAEQPGA